MIRLAVLTSACILAGCVTSTEMPLSQNTYRIQTDARGALFVGQAPRHTLRRAAELTLARGYTHFRLSDAGMATGSEFIGTTPGMAHTNVSVIGGMGWGTTTYTPGVPVRAPTASVGVTVTMYRAGEPGAQGAFDAAQVLRETQ